MHVGSITIAPMVCAQEGAHPQAPIPYRHWLKLKDNPEGLAKLGPTLPPVAEADLGSL